MPRVGDSVDERDSTLSGDASLVFERPSRPQEAASTLEAGERIGPLRIKRLLGAGGMGEVYLAKDTILGRSVALKVIRPELISKLGVSRFLSEGRLLGRLSHPNIVVLFGVGEHRGAPYLELELLQGESLRERIARGPLFLRETVRIAQQIASALAHAHAAEVVHCDLKPSNILIPPDGRARVVDFGLSALVDIDTISASKTRALRPSGTPAYLSPERWAGAPPQPSADIFAFGLVVHEMLFGRRPYATDARDYQAPRPAELGDIPPLLRTLLISTLARDPAERPSASQLAEKLENLLSSWTLSVGTPGATESPFRGLNYFDESSAGYFFGREEEISAIAERLRRSPVVTIAGASGSGKSSLARAGIRSRLRETHEWRVLLLEPGAKPIERLAQCLAMPGEDVAELERTLRARPGEVGEKLSALARAEGGRVLLIADQLEELITLAPPEDQRFFLETILAAADDVEEPVRVLFVVRDDFLGRFAPDLKTRRAFENIVLLGPMSAEKLAETVRGPLERSGYELDDPQLLEEMVREIAADIFALPMLQFICAKLWERRDRENKKLLRKELEAMGGVAGALASYAQSVLAEFSPDERRAARSILLGLVTPERTRRVLGEAHLAGAGDSFAASALRKLVQSRLVATRRTLRGEENETTYELAHESLIARWPTLTKWLDEARHHHVFLGDLEEAARVWNRSGRRAEYVLDPERLREIESKLRAAEIVPSEPVRELIQASDLHERRRRLARRIATAVAAGALLLITGASLWIARELAEKEQRTRETAQEKTLAAADVGIFELSIAAFDWDARELRAQPAAWSELADFQPVLWTSDRKNPHQPVKPKEGGFLEIRELTKENNSRIFRIQAESDAAFLELRGRNRAGEKCASSWIRLASLPGYAERSRNEYPRFTLNIPTCRATFAELVAIPAGPMISGGSGEPPCPRPELVDPERTVEVPEVYVDRTEISNAAYAMFAPLNGLTGYSPPNYSKAGPLHRSDLPDSPLSNINYVTALAYCRFMGKRLPSSLEWEKAARGGIYLDAARTIKNPHPRRNYPWGTGELRGHLNLLNMDDGFDGVAPVGELVAGASPYGLLQLAGNVGEWTSTSSGTAGSSMYIIRGGGWDSSVGSEHYSIAYENSRDGRFFSFGVGARCAWSPE